MMQTRLGHPPLKRYTVAGTATENPSASRLRSRSPGGPVKTVVLVWQQVKSSEKLRGSGSNQTLWASLQEIERIRYVAGNVARVFRRTVSTRAYFASSDVICWSTPLSDDGRVERRRADPNGAQPVPSCSVAQVEQIDAEPASIRELGRLLCLHGELAWN